MKGLTDFTLDTCHLYIRVNVYLGVMRYKLADGKFILIGTIAHKYGETYEESRIYVT